MLQGVRMGGDAHGKELGRLAAGWAGREEEKLKMGGDGSMRRSGQGVLSHRTLGREVRSPVEAGRWGRAGTRFLSFP